MANKISSKSRVNSIIKGFEDAGYIFNNWVEDGEYDSPKIEFDSGNGNDCPFLIAVESDHISVMMLDGKWKWNDYQNADVYLTSVGK